MPGARSYFDQAVDLLMDGAAASESSTDAKECFERLHRQDSGN